MLGIPFVRRRNRADAKPRAISREHARALADRGLHRAEALRDTVETVLPEAKEVIEDLREQAQPVVDRALKRKQRRSRKPLFFLILIAVAAAAAYYFWNRRDQEPAYLTSQPDRPDAQPDERPDGPVHIPGRSDAGGGTVPSAAGPTPRPVVMPTGRTEPAPSTTDEGASESEADEDVTREPASRFNGAAPAGSQVPRGPAEWDLPAAPPPAAPPTYGLG